MNADRILHPDRDAVAPLGANVPTVKGWQLVYTVARHERSVASHLAARSIDYFLPLYDVTRRWGHRSVLLSLPLFPSYIFVRLNGLNRRNIITAPGVVSIVSFQGQPAVIPEEQIEAIQNALRFRRAYPYPHTVCGKRVLIASGPLRGITGIVDRVKGLQVIVTVDCITRSIAIKIDAADLEPLGAASPVHVRS